MIPSRAEAFTTNTVLVAAHRELCCSICVDLLRQPTVLPCGHTFCDACAKKAIERLPQCPLCKSSASARSLLHIPVLSRVVSIAEAVARTFGEDDLAMNSQWSQSTPMGDASTTVSPVLRAVHTHETAAGAHPIAAAAEYNSGLSGTQAITYPPSWARSTSEISPWRLTGASSAARTTRVVQEGGQPQHTLHVNPAATQHSVAGGAASEVTPLLLRTPSSPTLGMARPRAAVCPAAAPAHARELFPTESATQRFHQLTSPNDTDGGQPHGASQPDRSASPAAAPTVASGSISHAADEACGALCAMCHTSSSNRASVSALLRKIVQGDSSCDRKLLQSMDEPKFNRLLGTLCGPFANPRCRSSKPKRDRLSDNGPASIPTERVPKLYVHYRCALWSSEVTQDELGVMSHVVDALRRGAKLNCSFCGERGATLGCAVGACRRSFHIPCALLCGPAVCQTVTLPGGKALLYCHAHYAAMTNRHTTSDE